MNNQLNTHHLPNYRHPQDGSDPNLHLLPPGITGTAKWILAPRDAAALLGPKFYLVGGTIKYTDEGGHQTTIPLAPARIEVRPEPKLVRGLPIGRA